MEKKLSYSNRNILSCQTKWFGHNTLARHKPHTFSKNWRWGLVLWQHRVYFPIFPATSVQLKTLALYIKQVQDDSESWEKKADQPGTYATIWWLVAWIFFDAPSIPDLKQKSADHKCNSLKNFKGLLLS